MTHDEIHDKINKAIADDLDADSEITRLRADVTRLRAALLLAKSVICDKHDGPPCPMPDEPGFREHIEADCRTFAERWDAAGKAINEALA